MDKTADIQELWPQLLQTVRNRRRFTWILLSQNAKVHFYDGSTLTLTLFNQGAYDNFVSSGSDAVLQEALGEVLNARPAVDLVVDGVPSTAAKVSTMKEHVTAAGKSFETSREPTEASQPTLQLVLAQTAFLLYEQGNSQAAALLADVEDVELVAGKRFGNVQDAALIMPAYLVPRFTDDVINAIGPVFCHVAGRHGFEVSSIAAAPALPEISEDWRHILQEKMATGAASHQGSKTPVQGVAPLPEGGQEGMSGSCTRFGKTTGRRCRRAAAAWPVYEDLPAPVTACAGHLAPQEWEACQKARERSRQEFAARVEEEHAAREARGESAESAGGSQVTRWPCIGECISEARLYGGDSSDGASMSCAKCESYVCVSCEQAEVKAVLEFCSSCSERESLYDVEFEAGWECDDEADTDPDPRSRLTIMVNDLVKATGATYQQVNIRINRRAGVITRVGADEQVIRRAAAAARAWLDELGSST